MSKKLQNRFSLYLPLAALFLVGLGLFRIGQLLFAPAWMDEYVTPMFEGSSLLSSCAAVAFFAVTLIEVARKPTAAQGSREYRAYLRNSK